MDRETSEDKFGWDSFLYTRSRKTISYVPKGQRFTPESNPVRRNNEETDTCEPDRQTGACH